MTLLSTRFKAAKNWSERLNVAQDIMAEVRAECEAEELHTVQNVQKVQIPIPESDKQCDS